MAVALRSSPFPTTRTLIGLKPSCIVHSSQSVISVVIEASILSFKKLTEYWALAFAFFF